MKYLDEKPSTSSLKPNMFKLNGILSPSLHYLFLFLFLLSLHHLTLSLDNPMKKSGKVVENHVDLFLSHALLILFLTCK
jgi:hypothetical protein